MVSQAVQLKKIKNIPNIRNYADIFFYIRNHTIDWSYLNYLKELTTFSDEVISDWLNISVKTLRAYRKPETTFKDNLKEHIVLILSLYEHGTSVFEHKENFDQWLNTKNVFFDGNEPKNYLDTIMGIKFIDDRLTAIEYGDNV
ncbi:antitoxin Xre/MbcA/ParS toxin-binding domain-containing protein [Pedobacter insulae]|uniref:Antitoxin Xre/MbcA/ParS-like toxin-binding domain-containing protein n=1 Tax=Pedobacter insulae TaxID=414048 RepID=A0A1I2SS42_9SPHI|nr:MbcA/ParS/Xre antitoxin family protein [Pedobacter insulae]SFG55488.1 Protein of unknown function [Pedobacter insulae]HTM97471.1 MbcA/ParS/Xre antitoxin family protein [Pedobacter sp.]